MNLKLSPTDAKAYVDDLYRKVAQRWDERVTQSEFMQQLAAGK